MSQARWRRWPAGQLDPAPPKGGSCVRSLTNTVKYSQYCQILKPVAPRVNPDGLLPSIVITFFLPERPNLGQLGPLVLHVRPSCPTWPPLGPNFTHLGTNLAQLSANLAQLGPNLAQLWSQPGATWPKNVAKMGFQRCSLATPGDVQCCIDFSIQAGSIFYVPRKAEILKNYK